MKLRRWMWLCLLSVLALSAPSLADSAPVTVAFTGEVLPLSFVVPSGLSSLIAPGDPVHGTFTFDTATPDSAPLSLVEGRYVQAPREYALVLYIGDAWLYSSSLTIQILNGFLFGVNTVDRFGVWSPTTSSLFPSLFVPNSGVQFFRTDSTASVFSSDALPLLPLDLSRFDPFPPLPGHQAYAQGQLSNTPAPDGPVIFVNFTVDTMQVVPEPTAAVLLSGVALAVWRRGRYRSRNRSCAATAG